MAVRDFERQAMKSVKVQRLELIDALETNKAEHAAAFEEALPLWRTQFIEKLEAHIAALKQGDDKVSSHISFAKPTLHIDEYDRAIDVFNWEQDDEVILDVNDFDRYVRDDWQWKGAFDAVVSGLSTVI